MKMRVIAQTHEGSYNRLDNRWLVELTEREINHIAGKEWGPSIDVKIGTEINISDVFKVANNVIKERKTVAQAVSNLRAMADLLESIEPTIRNAMVPMKDEAAEQMGSSEKEK
jgi:hypothetical protein